MAQNETRYFILSSDDEGETMALVGEQRAPSSDTALRKHFSDPPQESDTGLWFVAVAERHFQWREVRARVTTSIREPVQAQGVLAVEDEGAE